MPSTTAESVTSDDIAAFTRDGVVCLRGVIGQDWIERLLEGVEHTLANPSPRGRLWNRDDLGRESRYDSQVWRTRPEYADFVLESPLAEIAGRLMKSTQVNFFFDAMFARAPGTQFRKGERDRYDIASWDMEPGDIVCFNGRTIHGGSGNLPDDKELKVFNTKWVGDDVRVKFRTTGMDPDHTEAMTEVGLRSGDPLSTDLYPVVWSQQRR